ncbi:SusC/RagA family TonB-linked outer membrane protein [Hymenobacter weizhouensis]|uniref:SusC/RagA family TonB-linked outer membrane protein n=1 Tax=Hymenobacter sp. YIM 151500-1 TaxID=2987689 RepID=UPI0022267381|nr:SusC/RagA family TonB-linked outer membrane protein [Hymenobacter sp. YIM 151500-1]UYZ62596.1 SusC/RagA family TonB-linked outer membrane protein [Hymenobacter sp. YIM 151500-1]
MKKTLLSNVSALSAVGVVLLAAPAYAQTRTISGRVFDRVTTEGLPGVTVLLKGSGTGVSTNSDGTFILEVPGNGGTLVFSSIGYINVERELDDARQMEVGMAADTKQLSQVVVTALGIERQRKTLGYAVETLNNRDITRASEPNLLRSLQGRLAGVQISGATGAAGGATRVVIRGAQSFTGDNQPIYVVDGNVISNAALNSAGNTGGDLNNGVDLTNRAGDIDPNIVESITVLKGPAAAALYGSRAASGAIIITTKKGQNLKGRPQVAVSSAVTFERVNRLPEFQNTYGAGSTITAGPLAGRQVYSPTTNWSWGPRIQGQNVADWRTFRQRFSAGQPADSVRLSAKPDNIRDFFETGVTYNNAISFAGSNELSNYYVSVADARTSSFVPENNYKRTTVSLNGGTRLYEKLGISGTVNYIKSGGDRGIQGQSLAGIMQSLINVPRNIDITEAKDYNDSRYNLQNFHLAGFRNNPYFLLDKNRLTDNVDRLLSTAEVNYQPLQWLGFTLRQGIDFFSDRRRQQIAQGTVGNAAGRYIEDNIYGRNTTTDLLANVVHRITPDITAKGIFGVDYQQQAIERTTANGLGVVVPDFYDLSNTLSVRTTKGESKTRLLGYFADVQLSFRDYLYLGLTGRRDRSSTLRKAFYYPSANLGFIFTEAFKIQNSILSFGKVRANVASVGKVVQPYRERTVFVRGGIDDGFGGELQFPYGTVPAFQVGNFIGNPNLTNELTTAYEVGTELSFFNNRLGIDATYYNSRSKKIYVDLLLSSTTGFTSQAVNAGVMENKGIELAVAATPVRTDSGFSWDLNLTYTRNRNEVTEVSSTTSNIVIGGLGGSNVALNSQVGQPYGTFFGTKMLRDPEGRIVVDERTGFPRIDPNRQALGSIQPDFLAGVSTTLSYKGVALNVLFDARKGGKFYSQTVRDGYFVGTLKETAANDRQPFVVPNSVIQNADGSYSPNTKIADGGNSVWDGGRLYWQQYANTGENSLFDASFLKLRETSLSYTLPEELARQVRLGSIQVALIGRNLMLWTPKSQPHIDPEVSSFGTGNNQGFEYFSFPTTRSFGASLKLTL